MQCIFPAVLGKKIFFWNYELKYFTAIAVNSLSSIMSSIHRNIFSSQSEFRIGNQQQISWTAKVRHRSWDKKTATLKQKMRIENELLLQTVCILHLKIY